MSPGAHLLTVAVACMSAALAGRGRIGRARSRGDGGCGDWFSPERPDAIRPTLFRREQRHAPD